MSFRVCEETIPMSAMGFRPAQEGCRSAAVCYLMNVDGDLRPATCTLYPVPCTLYPVP